MVKRREIRNSTAEFLIFQAESKTDGIEVMYVEKTVWCTQDAIAILFDKSRTTITEHLNNIFKEGELQKDSVCRKFRRTASDGKEYNTQFYNSRRTDSGKSRCRARAHGAYILGERT